MTIFVKYKYLSKDEVKFVKQENLIDLDVIELATISHPLPECYRDLYNLLSKYSSDKTLIGITIDMSGRILISVPPDFDKYTFHSLLTDKWNGHWQFL